MLETMDWCKKLKELVQDPKLRGKLTLKLLKETEEFRKLFLMTMMQLWKHLHLLSLQVGPLTYFVYLQFKLYNNVIIQLYSLLLLIILHLIACRTY